MAEFETQFLFSLIKLPVLLIIIYFLFTDLNEVAMVKRTHLKLQGCRTEISLKEGTNTIGRGRVTRIADKSISRNQIIVTVTDGHIQVSGKQGSYITGKGVFRKMGKGDGEPILLKVGQFIHLSSEYPPLEVVEEALCGSDSPPDSPVVLGISTPHNATERTASAVDTFEKLMATTGPALNSELFAPRDFLAPTPVGGRQNRPSRLAFQTPTLKNHVPLPTSLMDVDFESQVITYNH